MRFATGKATDQGRVRDNNEDAFLVDAAHDLYAVADGMGGHLGGEVASHTAIEAVRASFAGGTPIDTAIEDANRAVLARAEGDAEVAGMGTTMTAVTVAGPQQLRIGHVGDSRAYLLRDGTLTRLTDDHTLVEELVREGRLTPEQAESHPQRSIVTRALGVDESVNVAIYTFDVAPGDRVVLCSDGLTTMLRERDVERIARTERDPQHAAEALVAAANDAGGEDNITVVVVDVLDVDEVRAAGTAPESEPAAGGVARSQPAPEYEAAPVAPARPSKMRTGLRSFRGLVIVLLPILIIFGVAAAALGSYARHSYYVGVSHDEVVIYKGVPGGVLGWQHTVDARTGLHLGDLSQLDRERVEANATKGSLGTVEAYVERLRSSATASTSTTTFATTTTTRAAPPTTVRP